MQPKINKSVGGSRNLREGVAILSYRMAIRSTEPVDTIYNCGENNIPVLLEVGKIYQIVHSKPTRKKDRANNGRIVEVLGFTDEFFGDVVVRYLDNNRRGRVRVNSLLPYTKCKK